MTQNRNATLPQTPQAAEPSSQRPLMLRLQPGMAGFSEADVAEVKRWVDGWHTRKPTRQVLMACDSSTPRSRRLRRMNVLADMLVDQGVAREQIRFTHDRIEPAPDHSGGDTVTLTLLDAAEANAEVRSIRSLVAASHRTHSQEPACTNAF